MRELIFIAYVSGGLALVCFVVLLLLDRKRPE